MHDLLVAPDGPIEVVGGKAAGLAKLLAAGFPTPPAAVVPPTVADEDLAAAAEAVAERFGPTALAIRSSAVGEDGSEQSYAGRFESVLDVASDAASIAAAIRRVRASANGEFAMAVLVMPMLQPDAAGIAFTRDPVTGADGVVIEAVAGVADGLAAGHVSGERWEIASDPRGPATPAVLDAHSAVRIADLAKRVEAALGGPQDIEWVLAGGELTLVQARPITALDDIKPVPMNVEYPPGPWDWDATHAQRPNSPFHGSFFPQAFRQASAKLAERFGLPIAGLDMQTIGGYIHIQLLPLVGKPGAPPPPQPLLKVLMRVMPAFRARTKIAQRALDERRDQEWVRRWHRERRPAFEATMAEWRDVDLASLSDTELAKHLTETVDQSIDCFGWNMTTDVGYLLPFADLVAFCEEHLDLPLSDVLRLVAGSSPSEYLQSIAELRALLTDAEVEAIREGRRVVGSARFRERWAAHRAVTGSRGLGYDVSEPTLAETSVDELAVIAAYESAADPSDAALAHAAELAGRLTEADRARFEALVAEARATYPIREESEYVNGRVVGYVRYALLEAGRRLVADGQLTSPEHAVYLTHDEILAWLDDRRPLEAGLIRRRRGEELWAIAHRPDGSRSDPNMTPSLTVFPAPIRRFMRAIGLIAANDMAPAGLDGRGVAASPGRYTGPVRRVEGVDDLTRVRSGDVLVAPLTNSAWEAVFPVIGALVTEGGGMLSHPAIVAREYGLPAVTGFEGALDTFADGELVTVDGSIGTVTSAG